MLPFLSLPLTASMISLIHSLLFTQPPAKAGLPTTLQPLQLMAINPLLTQNSLHASQITNDFIAKLSFFLPLLNFRLLKDKIRI